MPIAHSRVTAQGQISIPAEVRRRLGVGPGSILEWNEEGERIVVRRSACYRSEDIHRALFTQKEGIRRRVRERPARN
ncbi:MAG: AbrB/MazE/SpoVT family DNA-binding domain-containing protein [Planctomycetes bacterium]|nr:AbrB/MazE/SpoVT family DNA-binding domain-containing protein [Planctomycetota bacterium]